jgi:hypothetical protein
MVPDIAIGDCDTEEYPDDYFWKLKYGNSGYRIASSREDACLYLSPKGFKALKHLLANIPEKTVHGGDITLTAKEVEQKAEFFFAETRKNTQNHYDGLIKKANDYANHASEILNENQ